MDDQLSSPARNLLENDRGKAGAPRAITRIGVLYYPQLNIGGVEGHLCGLFRHIDQENFTWRIFAETSAAFKDASGLDDACFVPWHPRHALWDVGAYLRLAHLLRRESIDILHIHSPSVAPLGRWVAHSLGIPVVFTVHLPLKDYHGGQSKVRLQAALALHRWQNRGWADDRLVYVSQSALQRAIEEGETTVAQACWIPNGVDVDRFKHSDVARQRLRAAMQVDEDTVIFGCAGRLQSQKGFDGLLRALAGINQSLRPWQLWIAGEGSQLDELQRMVKQLDLFERVRFLGWRNDLPDIFSAWDVFVLPSRFEGTPLVLLEALAAGLPCVVTDLGDNTLLVGESGIAVPRENPLALGEALKMLLENVDQRQSMTHFALTVKKYRTADCALAVQDVYYGITIHE